MMHTVIIADADPDRRDDHPPQPDDHPVRHLGLADYAAAVGVSVATVRRRIRKGELAAVRVDGPYGPEWRIPAGDAHPDQPRRSPSLSDDADPDHGDDHPVQQGSDPELVALIGRQQQTIMELAGRLGFYQSEIQHLQAEVGQLKDQVTMLLAPPCPEMNIAEMAAPIGQAHAETTPAITSAPSAPNSSVERPTRRSWWPFRRWLERAL
jgi:hypothetical protein